MRTLLLLTVSLATLMPLTALAEDDPCDEAIVSLVIDVDTGRFAGVLADGSIDACSGEGCSWTTTTSVTLEFSSLDWTVDVTPTRGRAWSQSTVRGTTTVNLSSGDYDISFDPDDGGTNAPVPPVIILRPDKDCPPST